MLPKIFICCLIFIFLACENDEVGKVEVWKLKRYSLNTWCSLTFADDDSVVVEDYTNPILDALLGLDDSVYVTTAVQLRQDGKFCILKDNAPVLPGNWHMINTEMVFTANGKFFSFKVERNNSDSLILRHKDFYNDMSNFEFTLKNN